MPISIKPDREYLHEILAKLHDGSYTIPAFQRDFVWKKDQIYELFDSVAKDYPIGSILLWAPEKTQDNEPPIPSKEIINDTTTSDNPKSEFFILDGRQRLTAFYGCLYYNRLISRYSDDRLEPFTLGYNLDKEQFEFIPRSGRKVKYLYPVYRLYDTFELLELLTEINAEKIADDDCKRLITRAKSINARFQRYQIGEMFINDCNLDEASTVFSRINSKGTDISKVSMLQAMFFRRDNMMPLSDRLDEIIAKTARYGFDGMKAEDILNCCYIYKGKNFYDNNLLRNPSKIDFTAYLDAIDQNITNTAQFLHDECRIIDSSLMPYLKQFYAISMFFHRNTTITEEQKRELKRWVYYTSVKQTFQNSSMNNVRGVYNRFKEYIDGVKATAIDYEDITRDDIRLPRRFSKGSALSNFLILCMAIRYTERSSYDYDQLEYHNGYKLLGNDTVGIIPYFSKHDRQYVPHLFDKDNTTNLYLDDQELDCYVLSAEMVRIYTADDKDTFRRLRENTLIELVVSVLTRSGLKISSELMQYIGNRYAWYDTVTANQHLYFDAPDVTYYRWLRDNIDGYSKDYNDIYALYQTVSRAESYGPFEVKKTDGQLYLKATYGNDDTLRLASDKEQRDFLTTVERRYCDGLDIESYYGFRQQMDKDN